jgi:ElaA protein
MQAPEVLSSAAPIRWTLEPLRGLRPEELYDVMVLRQRVFVVEQACAYLDCDGHDEHALHLLGRSTADGSLHAYARLLGPGAKYVEASIGRVVVDAAVRRQGLGRVLMAEAIARTHAVYGSPLGLGAQLHLERFYGGFGFVRDGMPYRENGIPHVKMLLGR